VFKRAKWLTLVIVAATGAAGVAKAELTDPTRPPAHRVEQRLSDEDSGKEAGLTLSSILISPSRRLAIINGQLVAAGDPVASFTVSEIGTSSVTLRGPSGRLQLHLIPPTIKRERTRDEEGP
jgi:MSHA biogenesis protein MshK